MGRMRTWGAAARRSPVAWALVTVAVLALALFAVVLGLVAKGRTNSEIGQALYIGEATVKTHLLHAFSKLGVDDRTAAVTTAIARGLLPSPK